MVMQVTFPNELFENDTYKDRNSTTVTLMRLAISDLLNGIIVKTLTHTYMKNIYTFL